MRVRGDVEQETTRTSGESDDRKSGFSLSACATAGLGITRSRERSVRAESTHRRVERGQERYHIVFETLAAAFAKVTSALGDQGLWLMFDEW